jgi:hypothetical protein
MPNEPTTGPATDPRIRTLRERAEPSPVEQLANALRVLTLTPHTRQFLTQWDSKALEQAERALASVDTLPAETLAARVFGTTAETIGDALGIFYATRRDMLATELRRMVERIENEHGLTDSRHEHDTRHRELLDLADEVSNMAAMLRDTVQLHARARGVIA